MKKRMLVEIRFVRFNWITHGSRNLRNPRRDANFWYALPIPSDLRSLLAIRFLLNRWYVCRCWEFDFTNKVHAKSNFSKCKHPNNWCSEVWHMSVSFPVRCSFFTLQRGNPETCRTLMVVLVTKGAGPVPPKVDRAAVFGPCSSFDFGRMSTEFQLLLVETSKCCVGIYSKGITNPYDFSF